VTQAGYEPAGVTTMELPTDFTPQVDRSAKTDTSSSSGSSGRSSSGIEKPPEGAVKWLFAALSGNGEDIDIPAHEKNAERELSEQEIEAFGLEEGTNLSVESLFDVTIEREYIGNPKVREETFDDEKEAKAAGGSRVSENADGTFTVSFNLDDEEGTSSVDRHTKVDLGHAINGYFAEEIDDMFGPDVHISMRVGKSGRDYEDDYERAQYIRFKTTQGSTNDQGVSNSQRTKAKAKYECEDVDFSAADLQEWKVDNGFADE